jgi:Icc protein
MSRAANPTEANAISSAISRRRFIGTAGAGAAALALGSAPGLARARQPGRRPRLTIHAFSDVHVSDVYSITMQDFRSSLEDMWSVAPNPDVLVVNGDLTEYGQAQDFPLFDLALQTSPVPDRVLLGIGNHEYMSGAGETDAVMRQRFLDYAGLASVYYTTWVEGYPFVFAGSLATGFDATLGSDQLAWLAAALPRLARRDRPTFFFLHQPPENVVERAQLEAILRQTPNLIYLWGHWHEDLNWLRRGGDTRLLTNQNGYWSVSTGATTYVNEYVRKPDGSTGTVFRADWKQAVLLEVYDDAVHVRGRDFLERAWIDGFDRQIPIGSA